MRRSALWFGLVFVLCLSSPWPVTTAFSQVSAGTTQGLLASTPPMGWNSWDGYGTTVKEADVKANAQWFAEHLKPFGWQYVVVDMEWFVTNPIPEGNSKTSQFSIDGNGRYTPALNRFPTSANDAGFKPLADYVHSLGAQIWYPYSEGHSEAGGGEEPAYYRILLPGFGRCRYFRLVPLESGQLRPRCAKPAAQAYYDSIARLYASWEVDLIKVDCISSRPYKGDEIRMLSTALAKAGRPVALSLSPGPAPLDKTEEMRKYAQMWRISNDIWDLWHSTVEYPQGLGDQFANVENWAGKSQPGHWPDADMLPLGYLGPAPGWGKPRYTQLTHDEQRRLSRSGASSLHL